MMTRKWKIRFNCIWISLLLPLVTGFAQAGNPAANDIDVAVIYAFSGVAAKNNVLSIEGIYHAAAEINRAGGVRGRKINIMEFDNQSTPIGSTLAASKAALSDAVAILGAAWSSHSLPVAKVAQQMKIPMISNVSTNPMVTRIGDYIFRVCYTDLYQGKILAEFAHQNLDAGTAVIFINVASDYSLMLSQIFTSHFEKIAGTVLLELEYKTQQMPGDEEIRRAKASGADLIFIPGHDESGEIAGRLRAAGSQAVLLGGDGWASDRFLSRGGKNLDRAYYCTHWSTRMNTAKSMVFARNYIRSEISAANIALGYDAMMLLADAARRARSIDRRNIRQALADTAGFEGVTGIIRFDQMGDPVKNAVFMEIREGEAFYLETSSP